MMKLRGLKNWPVWVVNAKLLNGLVKKKSAYLGAFLFKFCGTQNLFITSINIIKNTKERTTDSAGLFWIKSIFPPIFINLELKTYYLFNSFLSKKSPNPSADGLGDYY